MALFSSSDVHTRHKLQFLQGFWRKKDAVTSWATSMTHGCCSLPRNEVILFKWHWANVIQLLGPSLAGRRFLNTSALKILRGVTFFFFKDTRKHCRSNCNSHTPPGRGACVVCSCGRVCECGHVETVGVHLGSVQTERELLAVCLFERRSVLNWFMLFFSHPSL